MTVLSNTLSEKARERVISSTQSSNGSADYKLMSLCYSVQNAEANLIYAVGRGFDTTAYEIRLGQLTAKLSQALEPLVTGRLPEQIQKRLDYLVLQRLANTKPLS